MSSRPSSLAWRKNDYVMMDAGANIAVGVLSAHIVAVLAFHAQQSIDDTEGVTLTINDCPTATLTN